MALKKKKIKTIAKRTLPSKRKRATNVLKKSIARKKTIRPKKAALSLSKKPKKPVLTEVTDLYERARWKKERREYWQNRFRKILGTVSAQSKVKK